MHAFSDMAKDLNRSPVNLSGLQARLQLPAFVGPRYSDAYLAFLRTIVSLRTLNISEDSLRDLWRLEKKLLQLLHVDSTGSKTWFLDSCGRKSNRQRRLLLSNHDLGVPLNDSEVQTGLNFGESLPELFVGREMGEDALRILRRCLQIRARILTEIAAELHHVRATANWAAPLAKQAPPL